MPQKSNKFEEERKQQQPPKQKERYLLAYPVDIKLQKARKRNIEILHGISLIGLTTSGPNKNNYI